MENLERERTVLSAHVEGWSAVGRALYLEQRYQEAYEWLSDWRQRPMISEFWVLLSFLDSCIALGYYENVLTDAAHALEAFDLRKESRVAPALFQRVLTAALKTGSLLPFCEIYDRFFLANVFAEQSPLLTSYLGLVRRVPQTKRVRGLWHLHREFKTLKLVESTEQWREVLHLGRNQIEKLVLTLIT